MIKLIILMALGKKIKQTRLVFIMLKGYLLFYMLVLPITNFAQSFEWVNPYPVNYQYNNDFLNYWVSVDNNNQVFWGGMFMFHENYANAAYGDLNIRKIDAGGNEVFAFYAYGQGNITYMKHDYDNNLILVIDIREDILLDSSDTLFHTGDGVSSHMVKLNSDFELLWTKMIKDGFSYSNPKGITIDSDNNIYYGLDNFQNSQIVILNSEGNEINIIAQQNVALISSLAVDDEGNIYLAGSCPSSGATFGGEVFEPPFSYNTYVAKYNNQMEIQWVNYVEDVTCPFPEVVVSDSEHIYFVGELFIPADFGTIHANGPNWVYDFFVAKLNSEGEFEWVAEVPESDTIAGDAARSKFNSFQIDSENNIYLTGFIRGDIDWGNGMVTNSTNIGYDLMVLKYNTDGDVIMTKFGGGESFDKTISSSIDLNDNLYIAGYGFDSTAFDNVETYHEGYYPFLLKLNNENINTGITMNEQVNSIQVYPNPVKDIVSIKLDKSIEESFTMRLQNMNGAVIKEITLSNTSEITIDMSEYLSGVYFLIMHSSTSEHSPHKIIKL